MANGIYDLISRGFPSTYAAANSFYNSKEYQDAKNYASIPATYGAALYGNYINKNVGENMARAFRTDDMNQRLSQQVGDQLPTGVNSGSLTYTDFGLDPVREYIGGGEYRNTREFNAPSFEKFMSLNSADAANALTQGNLNFTRDPSGNISYTGNRFDFPQPTFMNNNPVDIPLDELNVNAPEFRFTDYLQGKYDINKFDERPSENTLQATQRRQASSPRALGAEYIPEEEKGIFSLGDILADLGRKGVEGFKDVAGRGIKSKVLGGAGTMIGGPVVGGIAALAGLLTGGNMFDRSQSQMNFDNLSPEAQAYTSSLYGRQRDGTPGLLEGYNQISARGVGALGTLQNRLGNIQNRKAPQTPFSINLSNQIQDAIDNIISNKDKKAGMNAPNNIGLGGSGGDSGGDSGGGGSYGATGGEGPGAVSSDGRMGGGV